jgi:hypothetical protein
LESSPYGSRQPAEAFLEDVRVNLENQTGAGVRSQALDLAEIVASASELKRDVRSRERS